MLESLGLGEAASQDDADVVVFNTCTIREKPDQRLAAHLGAGEGAQGPRPGAGDRRRRLLRRGAARADLRALPVRRRRVRARARSRTSATGSAPAAMASRAARFGTATSAASRRRCRCTASAASRRGCRSRWAATRSARTASSRPCAAARRAGGRARSSREIERLARGRRPRGDAARPERELVRPRPAARRSRSGSRSSCAPSTRSTASSGSGSRARTRRTSAPDVIAAMAECARRLRARPPAAPVRLDADPQARCAARTRASGTCSSSRSCARRSRTSRSTTDLIVGFPGETEDDFEETLAVVEEVGFDSAFTFVFSPRAGPRRRRCRDQVPEEVKRERIERLIEVVQRIGAAAERRAGRPRRGGARRGPEPDRSGAPARPHAPQHDRQLRRRRAAPASSCRSDRRAPPRRRCAVPSSSPPPPEPAVLGIFGPTA